MEIGIRDILLMFAIVVSLLSFRLAQKSAKTTEDLEDKKREDEKIKRLHDASAPYVDLYHGEYLKTKEYTNELSRLLNSSFVSIENLFDKYDNNYGRDNKINKALGHIFNDTQKYIVSGLKKDLAFQSAGNIYYRLGYIQHLDIKMGDLEKEQNNHLDGEPHRIKEGLFVLEKSINDEDREKLYLDFVIIVAYIDMFFEKKRTKIQESIKLLENKLDRNKAEHFSFQENYHVYKLYFQLLNFLKFIDQSPINSLMERERERTKGVLYLPIPQILYISANMSMIDNILTDVQKP